LGRPTMATIGGLLRREEKGATGGQSSRPAPLVASSSTVGQLGRAERRSLTTLEAGP
jgi:hypothetical protein